MKKTKVCINQPNKSLSPITYTKSSAMENFLAKDARMTDWYARPELERRPNISRYLEGKDTYLNPPA